MAIFNFLTGGDPRDRFAQQVTKRLRKHGWRLGIAYDRARFALVLDGDAGTMYLANVFKDWLAYPRNERDAALDLLVRPAFEVKDGQSFEDVAPHLLPAIRHRAHVEVLNLHPDWTPDDVSGRQAMSEFCPPLAVLLAVDRPSSMAFVTEGSMTRWEKSFDDLLAVALENLRSRTAGEFERTPEGFFLSRYNDYYDASRLLLPHVFEALPLKGKPVAVVLSRTCVAVTGSEDNAALIELARFVEEAWKDETRPVALAPLILSEGEWRPFEPKEPALAEVLELSVKQRLWDYSGQTQPLQDHQERLGRDVFVSPLENVYDEGRIQTWTSWAEGLPTLAPLADVIALKSASGGSLARRWDDFVAIFGSLPPEPDLYPTRYRLTRWPSKELWARLEACEPVPWFTDG